MEQATSDQQTAEGALRAARDAVRIFGKTDVEINKIVAERMADPTLIVPSPISGRDHGAEMRRLGCWSSPAIAPAPYSVADISTMWMLANVAESDVPAFHLGQEVKVSVVGLSRQGVRRADHDDRCRWSIRIRIACWSARRSRIPITNCASGMFATFVIRTGDPVRSLAIPLDGVVREGDGTMTAWVTSDRRRFTQRPVKIGMQKDGFRQILEGLQPGELVATEGAVFFSNMLVIGASRRVSRAV